MALQTTVSLQLLLTADDQLSEVLQAIQDQIDLLTESFTALGDAASGISDEMDSEMGVVVDALDGATESVDTLAGSLDRASVAASAVTEATTAWGDAASGAGDQFDTLDATIATTMDAATAAVTQTLSLMEENFTGVTDAMAAAVRQFAEGWAAYVEQMGADWASVWPEVQAGVTQIVTDMGGIPRALSEAQAATAEWAATLDEVAVTATEVATETQATVTATTEAAAANAARGATGMPGGSILGGGFGGMMLKGGMGAMMGYFGLNMLGQAGNLPANVLSMMRGNNMTSGEAGQALAMLQYGGVSGSGASSFLSGMAGNLRTLFTPQIGTGMLSKNAILLQSLGITQQSLTQSPWMLMNTIAGRYGSLEHSGQGNAAAQLLQLTGTGQFQNAFNMWGSLAQQTKGSYTSGLSQAQVAGQAKQGMGLQVALIKLSMAFDTLAVSLIPLIAPLVASFTDLVDVFTGAKSLPAALAAVEKQLGAFGTALLAAAVAIRTYQAGRGVAQFVGNLGGGAAADTAASAAGTAGADVAATGAGAAEGAAAGSIFATLGASLGSVMAWAGAAAVAIGEGLAAALAAILSPIGLLVAAIAAVVVGIVLLIANWKAVTTWAGQVSAAVGRWTTTQAIPWIRSVATEIGTWAATQAIPWVQHVAGVVGQWTARNSTLTTVIEAMMGPLALLATHFSTVTTWTTTTAGALATWAGQTTTTLTTALGQLTADFAQWSAGLWNNIVQGLGSVASSFANWVSQLFAHITGGAGGVVSHAVHLPGNAMNWIQQAMKSAGVSGGSWMSGLAQLVGAESGGNPNAVSRTGVNYGGGHGIEHATGIAQMMPSTFAEYMKAGMSNILNPIDNLVASIRYISANFGNMSNLMARTGLGTGSYRGYASGGLLSEAVQGIGLSSGMGYMFGEAGPEWIVPQRGMGGAGGTGGGMNVNVNVVAGTADPQGLAQLVASQLVQQLKRRGNFAFG